MLLPPRFNYLSFPFPRIRLIVIHSSNYDVGESACSTYIHVCHEDVNADYWCLGNIARTRQIFGQKKDDWIASRRHSHDQMPQSETTT